ncbi:MAG: hydrogenase nickel insertion protein HypA [Acidobacteria bacterium]|nr:MAG: hydrogenase nickel insertion protein HypA [Acidobacteriota bacterium]
MHEFALADAVAGAAAEIAAREGIRRVTRLEVGLGELQRIEGGLFSFVLRDVLAREGGVLEGAEVVIESVPARCRCRSCGRRFRPLEGECGEEAREAIHLVPELAHAFLACPACGSPDFAIEEGRGVVLRRVEGER